MFIARILYPVKVLGPGKRIALWMVGCSHACKGCCNPELWIQSAEYYITSEKFEELIDNIASKFEVDGFTITGGDPFYNPSDLNNILDVLRKFSTDIIVYTGYRYDVLKKRCDCRDCLNKITVLIDGPYIEKYNNGSFLRGSSNQNIIILDEKYRDFYSKYTATGVNMIQNFMTKTGFISVGIHDKDYERKLNRLITNKNIIIED